MSDEELQVARSEGWTRRVVRWCADRLRAALFPRFCAACHLRSASVPHHDECPRANAITNGRHFRPTLEVTSRPKWQPREVEPIEPEPEVNTVSIARAAQKAARRAE